MATIRDVAREAGVSVGTVSNVLNDIPCVSEKKVKQVKDAIEKLGYRRNNLASQLRSNVSNTIGLIVPDITNPFYSEIARGVDDEAHRQNYNVFLCNKDRSEKLERELVNSLSAKCVDGIIILKPRISEKLIRKIREERSLLLFDTADGAPGEGILNVDDVSGIHLVAQKILQYGHRKVGLIYESDGSFSSESRKNAFLREMRDNGIPVPEEYCQKGYFTVEGGMDGFARLMRLPDPPTVVFCINDRMAVGAVYQAKNMGLEVPGDVSVVGYDDIPEAKWTSPALSTVSHPKQVLGEICSKMLFSQIAKKNNRIFVDENIDLSVLKPFFVERVSLGPVRA
ncbi:MAG: LacI family transcriptional regulator [Lachnospiraceae bacterium]|nr:LacI family transcriptional regulator [Lachnospiraceae bacterium]